MTENPVVITLKLTAEDASLLDKAAREHRVSRSKFIRDALKSLEPAMTATPSRRGSYKPRKDAYSLARVIDKLEREGGALV